MKNFSILLLFVVSISPSGYSKTVKFSYDACGNRIKREIVLSQKARPQTVANPHEEILSDRTVRIYPNPTKGALKLELSGFGITDRYYVSIYSLEGPLILDTASGEPTFECDLSSQPNGMYILRLVFDNREECIWKIIKE